MKRQYWEIRELQRQCWDHGHKAWAKKLGVILREMLADDPDLRIYN